MQKLELAQEIRERIKKILETVHREFESLTDEQLSRKPAPDRWSIIQCLQHLNLAERYYIRNIQKKVDDLGLISINPADQLVESDWIGKIILYVVDPKARLKMPSPKLVQPRENLAVREVYNQFIELQQLLLELLDKAIYLDWNLDKVPSLFGNWLKIRLGDTFLMLIRHTERHIQQAFRVQTELERNPI